jgi:ribosomal protein L3 glutamine methyltransferase
MLLLSYNYKRNRLYRSFLGFAKFSRLTVEDMIRFGISIMSPENLLYSLGSAEEDSQYLAFFSLNLPHEYDRELFRKAKVSPREIKIFLRLLEKRVSTRVPLAYVVNEWHYLGWRFHVNKHTLVPRSLMNNKFQEFLNETQWENYRVLDLCTGSGCIGISLALLDPRISVDLVDISKEALKIAQKNIEMYYLKDRVKTIHSDLWSNVVEKYDLIVTNPPYVPTEEYEQCADECKREPKTALEAGPRGLDIVNRILLEGWKFLNERGALIAEVGFSPQTYCTEDFPRVPFEWVPNGYEDNLGRTGVFRVWQGYQFYLPY